MMKTMTKTIAIGSFLGLTGGFAAPVAAGGAAIVPVSQTRNVTVDIFSTCGTPSDDDGSLAVGNWNETVNTSVSCPDGTSSLTSASQNSNIDGFGLSGTGSAQASTTDPGQVCSTLGANGGSTYAVEFSLATFSAVNLDGDITAFGGDTGFGQACLELDGLFSASVFGSFGQDSETVAETFYLTPGTYTFTANATGSVSTNCCCDGFDAEFDFTMAVFPSADTNQDGLVNIQDLTAVLAGWGTCAGGPEKCPGDTDYNGIVNVADLLLVIGNWS